jgi:hypothetical protein
MEYLLVSLGFSGLAMSYGVILFAHADLDTM